ncbi:MAG TPA: PAS domain S-box protein, partial [Luteimonas sp.]|nr:PAS domain S-box protein [Luteimonas sp.]
MLNSQITDPETDDRFRLAMSSSGIGMAIVDLEGRWLEVNPAMERMFGYPASELVGTSADALTHPEDREVSRDYLQQLVAGGLPVLDAQKRYLHRQGRVVWAHVNVAAMRGADGQPCYLIAQLRDISSERAAQEQLRSWGSDLEQRVGERTAELERINREQDLFAYGVSHDLRAPLRSIDGFAKVLAGQYGDRLDDTGRDYLGRIRKATARMSVLIDALLELSRASRADFKST